MFRAYRLSSRASLLSCCGDIGIKRREAGGLGWSGIYRRCEIRNSACLVSGGLPILACRARTGVGKGRGEAENTVSGKVEKASVSLVISMTT